jgi:hypothetical protein
MLLLFLVYGWSWFDGNQAYRLLAKHFGYDKNQNRAAKPAAQ